MLSEAILQRISDAELLNFGSGPSAYAFDYEAAGINGVNLGMTPSAFPLETAFLRQYRAAFRKGCPVVFAVCPFSFGDNRDSGNPFRFARYTRVLPRSAIDALPEPFARWNAKAAESVAQDEPLFPYAPLDRDEVPTDAVLTNRLEAMCDCWKQQFALRDFGDATQATAHQKAFCTKRKMLEETLASAQEIGLRPYLLLPPLHARLRARISPAFFEAFVRNPLQDIGVPILDYTDSPLLFPAHFLGPVFLNRTGAVRLTQDVFRRVHHD